MAPTREVVDSRSIARAVALLTRQHLSPDISRAEVLDGSDPEDVHRGAGGIAGGLLNAALPGEAGTALLRRIGLWAADMEVGASRGR